MICILHFGYKYALNATKIRNGDLHQGVDPGMGGAVDALNALTVTSECNRSHTL